MTIFREAIYPILKRLDYSQIQLKLGIDTNEHSAIRYTIGQETCLEIVGYGISIAPNCHHLQSLSNNYKSCYL